jgi:hypothetical protein
MKDRMPHTRPPRKLKQNLRFEKTAPAAGSELKFPAAAACVREASRFIQVARGVLQPDANTTH